MVNFSQQMMFLRENPLDYNRKKIIDPYNSKVCVYYLLYTGTPRCTGANCVHLNVQTSNGILY